MASDADLLPRQIWANPPPTTTSLPRHCTPFRLPSGGFLAVGDGSTITLAQEAVFQPLCTSISDFNATPPSPDSPTFDDKDPFYASTLPQMYAIAAVTVVSYLLVIILFITPRTFFIGGSGGGGGFLGQRGMISGASGSASVVGVGGRPWLQKVAALTVAISLTIASVDTFRVAERQYAGDYSDVTALTDEVVSSLELRIVRVVSETCLWLAQAQTLIRLFPRHKEKVIIKWAGFVLIALDTIFGILNNFVSGRSRDATRSFQDAVPALSYLFTFCLSLIYAAWIIYYSLSKRRYAFIHPKMRNICLVALFSYVAILIPVVFFILDISIYDVAGWGNYVRWVGAAAASVVVWEWVERIEALERDERKDGILGREIFDGDEMLEVTPSTAVTWSNSRRFSGSGGKDNSPTTSTSIGGLASIARRFHRKRQRSGQGAIRASRRTSSHLVNEYTMTGAGHHASVPSSQLTPPPILRSSVDQSTSTEAGSPVSTGNLKTIIESSPQQQPSDSISSENPDKTNSSEIRSKTQGMNSSLAKMLWDTVQKIPIPFLNRHMSPPIEVKQAVRSSQPPTGNIDDSQTGSEPPVANTQSLFHRIGLKKTGPAPKVPLPITVVPAPPRNRTDWNEVRFYTSSSSPSRPPSQNNAPSQVASHDLPLDHFSRRSTPVVGGPVNNRYSSAPAQLHRMSRALSPTIAEHTGVEDRGVSPEAAPSIRRAEIMTGAVGSPQETSPQHGTSLPQTPPPPAP